jgi:uncharacterized protein YkwD
MLAQELSPATYSYSTETTVSASSSGNSSATSSDEQEILKLVNRERQSRGLAPLIGDARLTQAARLHSQRMAAANEIGHQLPGEPELEMRLGRTALLFDLSGENVAMAGDAYRAHVALMNSPHHRDNILERGYSYVGIGVVRSGHEVFVTQDFAHLLPRVSVEQAEEKVAERINQERGTRGLERLERVQEPELRSRACEMAATDRANPRVGFLPRVNSAVAFTAMDLEQISDSLRSLKTRPARAFAVGACYQSSASYQNPVFWILVVTYM